MVEPVTFGSGLPALFIYRELNMSPMLKLLPTFSNSPYLAERMRRHYSKPEGFVGRRLPYAIYWNNTYYGHIVAGSATRYLANRWQFLNSVCDLNEIINNVFFSVSRIDNKYPRRNFVPFIINEFVERSVMDWEKNYGNKVVAIETLVEPPRTGESYLRAGFQFIGKTVGMTASRVKGKETGSKYTGKRIWEMKDLRPKLIFMKDLRAQNEL
jgi:hypothetical protein